MIEEHLTEKPKQNRYRRPRAQWIQPAAAPEIAAELERALRISPVVAQILANRGIGTIEAAQQFLNPELDALHDPFLLTGMERAVARLEAAVAQREPILIYGDYDVDGTTSVVVLKKTIELLGGCAEFHIPHRLTEGYGMRTEVVDAAARKGFRVIVSVDTGIRAHEPAERAAAMGIDLIITDHHLPETELPEAYSVLNPNQPGCCYPCKHLCGAGVTFKLAQALVTRSNLPGKRKRALLDSFLKPVAIATVADIVPLTGENRVIVRRGLSGLRKVRNPGLRALLGVAGLEDGEAPSAHQVAFQLAPRINAAGRMATARDVIELFLTADSERAREIAVQLDSHNRERQQVEREIVDAIVAQCEADESHLELAGLVFWAPEWHLGVLGIVASRLVERFYRPVFVLGTGVPDVSGAPSLTGSGRSIPGFHLLEALENMSDLFSRFGGHSGAAGVTIPAIQAEIFRERFAQYAADRLSEDDRRPKFFVDAELPLESVRDSVVREILDLGPFGFGNPAPLFECRNIQVAAEPRPIGSSGKHLNIPLHRNGRTIFAKAWNFGDRLDLLQPGAKVDVLFQLEEDAMSRKRGYAGWSVSVRDVRPAVF